MTTGRVLVTGANGFVGRHLLDALLNEPDLRVHGSGRQSWSPETAARYALVAYLPGDLTRADDADRVVRAARPDWVVHLAAQSSVAESWRDPAGTLVNNLVAQLNLQESLVRHAPASRVLVVGSSEEYGQIRPEDLPADEATPLRPDNPYAVSKIAQDYLGLQYYLGRRLTVVRARPFNLFGPGQSDRFAIGSFARQVAEAEAGMREPVVTVGNLSARRDYTDVRDAVRAYWLLVRRGAAGDVYNVGGGGVHSIGEVLDALIALARRPLEVRVDPGRLRPADTPEVAPDASHIRHELGWQPRIAFHQTVSDTLDDWRQRIAAPAT
jgi:GDP-4-dehydro-6-deoxy-D-mannose reductase